MRGFWIGAVTVLAACSDPARCGDGRIEPGQVCYERGGAYTFPTSDDVASGTRLADVTGDGLSDAVVTRGVAVRVAPGVGAGELGSIQTVAEGGDRWLLRATADLDGDGRDDLVLSERDPAALEVMLSRGTPEALQVERIPVGPVAGLLTTVTPADVDGDDIPDLLAEIHGPEDLPDEEAGLSVRPGVGDGTFLSRTTHPMRIDNSGYVGLAVGDFDDDGRDDVVRNASLAVELRRGEDLATVVTLETIPGSFAVLDVNEDGVDDLVVVHDLKAALSILFGESGVGLGPGQSITLDPPSKTLAFVLDVDADGAPELATWRTSADALEVLRVGPAAVERLGTVPLGPYGNGPARLLTGELNGDGVTDLAVAWDHDMSDEELGVDVWNSAP